jgi:hypothetical protein
MKKQENQEEKIKIKKELNICECSTDNFSLTVTKDCPDLYSWEISFQIDEPVKISIEIEDKKRIFGKGYLKGTIIGDGALENWLKIK